MPATAQYEVVAILKNGCIQRAHSTDGEQARRTYNAIPLDTVHYKVLWKSYDHTSSDPIVVSSWPRR